MGMHIVCSQSQSCAIAVAFFACLHSLRYLHSTLCAISSRSSLLFIARFAFRFLRYSFLHPCAIFIAFLHYVHRTMCASFASSLHCLCFLNRMLFIARFALSSCAFYCNIVFQSLFAVLFPAPLPCPPVGKQEVSAAATWRATRVTLSV